MIKNPHFQLLQHNLIACYNHYHADIAFASFANARIAFVLAQVAEDNCKGIHATKSLETTMLVESNTQ